MLFFLVGVQITGTIFSYTHQKINMEIGFILIVSPELSRMLIIETWVTMVGDGPGCCRSGRRVNNGRQVYNDRWALVQLGVAKASLKHALSSATRVEGPLNNVQNNSFVLVPRLYDNLRCILQNPDCILQKL